MAVYAVFTKYFQVKFHEIFSFLLFSNWNQIEAIKNINRGNREIDTESEICSVIIPPPLPPVQSHAVLEKSLGIPIPRTPARTPKFSTTSTGSTTSGGSMPAPPLPTRTSSKLVSHKKCYDLYQKIRVLFQSL